jgi:hypothetical protein
MLSTRARFPVYPTLLMRSMLRIALICRVVPRLLMSLVVRIALIGFVFGFTAFHGGSPRWLRTSSVQFASNNISWAWVN